MFDLILDILFPPHCVVCTARLAQGGIICDPCLTNVSISRTLFCGRCLARLPESRKICHHDTPYLFGAAADYGNAAVKGLIHVMKFGSLRHASKPLADLLIRYAASLALPSTDRIVVPVPLGTQRARERGFNQAELIASHFAEHFSLPVITNAIRRARETDPQAERRSAEERWSNVRNCFVVDRREVIRGAHVILIDDVRTSGATLQNAARALKDAGAKNIVALTVAKT